MFAICDARRRTCAQNVLYGILGFDSDSGLEFKKNKKWGPHGERRVIDKADKAATFVTTVHHCVTM